MLITLVIIGVIAALTLPTLIGKYQKHQAVVGLKKAYSEISNAVRMSVAENGDTSTWTWDWSEAWVDKYLIPYFKIVKTENFLDVKNKVGGYYQISGQPETNLAIMSGGEPAKVITLPSGAQIWLKYNINLYSNNLTKFYNIIVDINGYKKPNTFGKDIFSLSILRNDGKVTMHAWYALDANPIQRTKAEIKSISCNKHGTGDWCGALIQADGWEIKDDYPW